MAFFSMAHILVEAVICGIPYQESMKGRTRNIKTTNPVINTIMNPIDSVRKSQDLEGRITLTKGDWPVLAELAASIL
jgi:hypothetical protein